MILSRAHSLNGFFRILGFAAFLAIVAGCGTDSRRVPERFEALANAVERSAGPVRGVWMREGKGEFRGSRELWIVYESKSMEKPMELRDEYVAVARLCKRYSPEPFDRVWIEAQSARKRLFYRKIWKKRARIESDDIDRGRYRGRTEI